MPPVMMILAGPNGAGKSTLATTAQGFFKALGVDRFTKLNADEKTLELRAEKPGVDLRTLNLEAANFIDGQVEAMIEQGKSFLVETVLSSGKYRDDVEAAKAKGFAFILVYVSLHPPELSPARVAVRVQKGGHNVDQVKALERYVKSHEELEWFGKQADFVAIYDNSSPNGEPVKLYQREGGNTQHWEKGINPSVDKAIKAF